jgi:uncharacterized membrane protein
MKKIITKLPLIISLVFIIATLLAILAPLFAYLKLDYLSSPIYWFYQWFCHQRPWRSYHMFDYQYALDARMITLFLGLGIGGLLTYLKRLSPLKWKQALLLIVVMLIPMAVDGITQLVAELSMINNVYQLPFYESTNLIRSITGIFAGVGISVAIFPYLNGTEFVDISKKYIKTILLGMFITSLSIPIIVFFWFVSSTKYKPSSIFIDSLQRFPGYNYEVTTGGGHSTINRVIKEPTNIYEQRERYYQKELRDQCNIGNNENCSK